MQRVGILNGNNITYDHDFGKILKQITTGGILEGGEIVDNKIQPFHASILCTRTNGQEVIVHFETDEEFNLASVEGVVYVEVNQDAIDDGLSNNENGTGIAEIKVGSNRPTKNFIKLYSITSGEITDERNLEPNVTDVKELQERMNEAEADITELQVAGATDHLEDRGLCGTYYAEGDYLFRQKTATYDNSTETANVGDVAADTELHIQRLGSGVESNQLKLKVRMSGSPTTTLMVEVRKGVKVVNTNKKESYWYGDSSQVIASGSLEYTNFSSSWQEVTFILDGNFGGTKGELLDICVFQQNKIVNASNFYVLGCDATQQSDALQFIKVNGTTRKQAGLIPYCVSDGFADVVMEKVTTEGAYALPRNYKDIGEEVRVTTHGRHSDGNWLEHKSEDSVEYIHGGYKTLTIKRAETSTPNAAFIEYADDLEGYTLGSDEAKNFIDKFLGFSGVRLNRYGKETGTVDLTNMSAENSLGSGDNVMVKFPMRGIKLNKSGTTCTLSITDNPNAENEGFQYYAHSRGTLSNPIKKKQFYMGVYEASVESGVMQSLSGKTVFTKDNGNATMQDFINYARANDSNDGSEGYDIVGFYQRGFLIAISQLKFGGLNFQALIGQGIVSGSKQSTGGSNSISGHTGGNTGNSTTAVKLFGVENPYGNVNEWVGGLCTDGSKSLWTALSGFVGDIKTTAPYENTGTTITTTSGNCLSAIAGNNKAMFAPVGTVNNSNYNTYYSDYVNVNASRLASAGGYYSSGASAGLFLLYVYHSASSSAADVGARLMFL